MDALVIPASIDELVNAAPARDPLELGAGAASRFGVLPHAHVLHNTASMTRRITA
jgi:hypothetical protein